MITGVCLNPSFDKTVEVDALALGEVNRIRSVRVDMGGKGVNVAVVARRLGLDALCIGCMGEQGAQHFTRLMDAEGLPHRFLTVPGAVRTNLKVVSRDGKGVTELNEPGAPLSGKALYCCAWERRRPPAPNMWYSPVPCPRDVPMTPTGN